MAMGGNVSGAIYKMRRSIKNKSPLTKWTLYANVYGVHDGTHLHARGFEKLRKTENSAGDEIYVMKYSNDDILAPTVGTEDIEGGLTLVKVGEHDYRAATAKLGEDGKNIIMSLKDDETMKYQFAKACEEKAFRYRPEEQWFQAGIIYLIVLVLAGIFFLILLYTMMTGQLQAITEPIVSAIKENTNTMSRLLGNAPGLVPKGIGLPPT